jgi:hypothetical protein
MSAVDDKITHSKSETQFHMPFILLERVPPDSRQQNPHGPGITISFLHIRSMEETLQAPRNNSVASGFLVNKTRSQAEEFIHQGGVIRHIRITRIVTRDYANKCDLILIEPPQNEKRSDERSQIVSHNDQEQNYDSYVS